MDISTKDDWLDPFAGTRASLDLSPAWNLAGEFDVGGFGIGSRLSVNTQASIGYRLPHLGRDAQIRIGYRAYFVDYESRDISWHGTEHGPMLGLSVKF